MSSRRSHTLPISGRDIPISPAWLGELTFLTEAGAGSHKTETTYRSGLRLFADWLQHFRRAGFDESLSLASFRPGIGYGNGAQFPHLAATQPVPLNDHDLHGGGRRLSQFPGWTGLNCPQGYSWANYNASLAGTRSTVTRRKQSSTWTMLARVFPQSSTITTNCLYRPKTTATTDDFRCYATGRWSRCFTQQPPESQRSWRSTATTVDQGRATHATIIGKGGRARTIHLRDYAQNALQKLPARTAGQQPSPVHRP